MNITRKINHLLIENNLTAYKLAELIEISQPALSYKMKNGSFKVDDLIKISKVTNTELEINFNKK